MADAGEYSYEPIQPDQLRLCRYIQDDDTLCAVLQPFAAKGSHPPYVALSYAWGLQHAGAKERWNLRIGQQHLAMLHSLRPFIQALRARGTLLDGTWWWIDSICIDQANLVERGQHVRRMKHIYQKAHQVVVWLGPESDDSDLALEFIHFLDDLNATAITTDRLRSLLLQGQYRAKWVALRNFFSRTWWTRIWTIQEFIISSNVTFWCGPRHLTREEIFAALAMADRCSAPDFKGTIAFHNAFHRRRAWLLYESLRASDMQLHLSLLSLTAYFCSNEATDDRDRIYGLFGLSTENHGLDIDYSWHVDEVYLRFAQSFIAEHKSLDILSFASLFVPVQASSLPSWVPDWRTRIQPFVVPLMVSQSSTEFVGNLRPPRLLGQSTGSLHYSASGSRVANFSFQGSMLLVRGCVIDAVDGLAANRDSELVQSSEHYSPASETDHPSTATLTSICRSLTVNRGDRYLTSVMDSETFYRDFVHLCLLLTTEDANLVHEAFRRWYRSTRDLVFHGSRLDDILRNARDSQSAMLMELAPNQDEYIQDSFFGRFFDIVERWSLRTMTSRNGRIGMAAAKAVKGDLICLVFGCSVPLILRRKKDKPEFTIIGECYLDGCMNGQATEQYDAPEETFHIV